MHDSGATGDPAPAPAPDRGPATTSTTGKSDSAARTGSAESGRRPVVKRTARAILLDGDDLLLIKRTKPGMDPYWITPGGGMEPGDATVVEALRREVHEELGGKVVDVVPAFVDTVTREHDAEIAEGGVKVQYFFVCRLESMDPSLRHGPEVEKPNGTYEIVRIPFTRQGVTSVNVVPASLRAYLAANIEGVLALFARDLS